MAYRAFDILKKDQTGLIWVEAARDLESAQLRIAQLAAMSADEYVIFDHSAGVCGQIC